MLQKLCTCISLILHSCIISQTHFVCCQKLDHLANLGGDACLVPHQLYFYTLALKPVSPRVMMWFPSSRTIHRLFILQLSWTNTIFHIATSKCAVDKYVHILNAGGLALYHMSIPSNVMNCGFCFTIEASKHVCDKVDQSNSEIKHPCLSERMCPFSNTPQQQDCRS